MTDKARRAIEGLETLDTGLHGRDLLLTWEHSESDLRAVLAVAEILEELWAENVDARVFAGGLAVSIFRDQSTRTRFSFASAASLLGLSLMDLDEKKSQVAHGETVRETANMISFLTEAVGIRDDMFVGEGHEYMVEVSRSVEEGFQEQVLPQRPALVNLQCDRDHPTQTLADLLHLKQTFGSLAALAGKKLVMSWAYSPSYGKPLSVAQGVVGLMTRFGMNVTLAYPPGFDLMPELTEIARRQTAESGGAFEVVDSIDEAFAGADVVYPKSWAPFEIMQRRTDYLRGGESHKLEGLEKECLAIAREHREWECTEDLMAKTRDGKALYMHCLPADITGVSCAAGEVAASVFERYRLATYRQAKHKPFVIAAMILANRFRRPARLLGEVLEGRRFRRRTESPV